MSLFTYIRDTRAELKHVAWPTQTQTTIFTAMVIAVSILIALYLGALDFVFTKGLESVLPGSTAATQQPVVDIVQEPVADPSFSATGVTEDGDTVPLQLDSVEFDGAPVSQ